MKIFDFSTKSSTPQILIEHLVLSVLAFSGSYCLILLGPLLYEEFFVFEYFSNPPKQLLAICLPLPILTNIILLIRKSRRHHLSSLYLDEDKGTLVFKLCSLYPRKKLTRELPLSMLNLQIRSNNFWMIDRKEVVVFGDVKNRPFAKIDLSLEPWASHRTDLKAGVALLNKLAVEKSWR